jgi:hypothetical protein
MSTPFQPSLDSQSSGRPAPVPSSGPVDKTHEAVDSLRGTAAGGVEKLADGVEAAAAQLDRDDVGQLSQYIHGMASTMTDIARDMREKSGDDMVAQVSRLAREKPGTFVTGSILAGLALARFGRASRHSRQLPVPVDEARVSIDPQSKTGDGQASAKAATASPVAGRPQPRTTYTGGLHP